MLNSSTKSLRTLAAVAAVLVLTAFQQASANEPFLAFSDLISGPDTGLGDGNGSGAVVTVWGQNLGVTGSDRTLKFIDSSGQAFEPHVYYWKHADGALPSGPANLYESHRMQEIAFSVPDAATGTGEIVVTVNGLESNSLPFTVRSGNIYHVKSSGSDSGSGGWNDAWRTLGHAIDTAPAGSTIYLHDVDSGSSSSVRSLYWNNAGASSTLGAQFSVIAFPGFQPKITAQRAVETYNTEALVVSKLDLYASNYKSVDSNDQPSGSVIASGATYGIESSKNGRAVANRIGDIPGGCASKYHGAIVGNAKFSDKVSNYMILGNEVYDYGCAGTNKLHHTTYMSIRSEGDDLQVDPWEFGYNYLHGNKAKFGIHQFDQNEGCGDTTGPIRIHNNVVMDQGGAGISVGSQCNWSMDVYIENNVLINVGLAADWDGVDPNTSDGVENGGIAIRDSGLLGTMYIRNNLIHGYTNDGQVEGTGGRGCLNFNGSSDNVSVVWSNNICYTEKDIPFVGAGYRADAKLDNVSGSHNVWHATSGNLSAPSWDTYPLEEDPALNLSEPQVSVSSTSTIVDLATDTPVEKDIYGVPRGTAPDIGPVEFLNAAPKPPSAVTVN